MLIQEGAVFTGRKEIYTLAELKIAKGYNQTWFA
jgi:hypothetical protein